MRLTGIAALAAAGVFAASAVASAAPSPLPLLRPPGAGAPEHFAARCVRCGRCLEACPYQAIHAAPLNAGREASTPFVNARSQACRLCVEFPCAAVCPTGALEVPAERRAAGMGVAVINEDTCLSFQGMRCEVCYRACPLIDEAITHRLPAPRGRRHPRGVRAAGGARWVPGLRPVRAALPGERPRARHCGGAHRRRRGNLRGPPQRRHRPSRYGEGGAYFPGALDRKGGTRWN